MVIIQKVEIKNFQKHKDLTLSFSDKVNVVFGESGVGKSCIRRALEWCLFNASIDGVRKQGTKETSVKVFLQNGIWIERVRSASKNQYRFHNGDGVVVAFDAIGKTIPDEIKNAIGIASIKLDKDEIYLNSSPQISLPFLFDVSGTERMKLFNRLTGNDVLDELLVSFNKDILRVGKDLKSEEEKFLILEKSVEEKEIEKEKLEAIFKKGEGAVKKTKECFEEYHKLQELKELQTKLKEDLVACEGVLEAIKIPDVSEIQGLTEKYITLEAQNKALLSLQNQLTSVEADLSGITLLQSSLTEEIGAKIEVFETLNDRLDKLEVA